MDITDTSSEQAPKLQYPCDYPIKVLGKAAPDFQDFVFHIVKQHAPELSSDKITSRDSSGGRFASITVTIVATGEAQIMAIFEDLKKSGRVKMVL